MYLDQLRRIVIIESYSHPDLLGIIKHGVNIGDIISNAGDSTTGIDGGRGSSSIRFFILFFCIVVVT
jgi:hypothetical protein